MEQAQITVLKFPDSVRLRKEMYLINPDHCFYEIIDNSVDEFSAGRCKTIDVEIKKSNSVFREIIVKDDGGGIPTTLSKDPDHKGFIDAEIALSTLSAGGKFQQTGSYTTNTSGLHGVGASCVNAVSNSFNATIYHDKTVTELNFEKGIIKKRSINKPFSQDIHGTTISFVLDDTLWKDESYNFETIKKRLLQLSYLNPGLKINYKNSFNNSTEEIGYYHEKGLSEYFSDLISNKSMLDTTPITIEKIVNNDQVGDIQISIALGYSTGYSSEIYSFVNNVNTAGGDHVTGFNAGTAKAITAYFASNDKYKSLNKVLTSEDTKEGLVALISVKVMAPKFEGQSKSSIKMPEVRNAVSTVVFEEVKFYLEQHPNFSKLLADKLEKATKARIAAKRAREAIRNAKNTLESSLPGKLAACSSKKPEESEIYLVEGDSAAGSAVQARDSKTQAILPVFGKILNTEKSREDEVLNNSKLLDVIKALKCGIGKTFDIDKLRYHKIIIMADADVDGAHITNLWITFFFRFMPQIIEKGYLYIAVSPLYRVTEKINKEEVFSYYYDDQSLSEYEANHSSYHVSYIKGLGELQPIQLWDSTMDPAKRHMIQITSNDAEEAFKMIELCMGSEVAPRKDFILDKIDFAKVVD